MTSVQFPQEVVYIDYPNTTIAASSSTAITVDTYPVAKRIPHIHCAHDDRRYDEYHWMRQKQEPDFIQYLKAWNDHTKKLMEPLKPLQEKLYKEMTNRIERDYRSVPYKLGSYEYYRSYSGDLEHPIYCRKHINGGEEEVILDGNIEAKKYPYFDIQDYECSLNGKYVAFAIDTDGSQFSSIYIKNMDTGEFLNEEILLGSCGQFCWNSLSDGLWYVKGNELKRNNQVFFHKIGSQVNEDKKILEETDELFDVCISQDKQYRHLFVTTKSKDTSEVSRYPLDDPDAPPQIFQPKEKGMFYSVCNENDTYIILVWEMAQNCAVYVASEVCSRDQWICSIPASKDIEIDNLQLFENFLVYQKRINGLPFFEVTNRFTGQIHQIPLPQEVCDISFENNFDYHTDLVRFTFNSPITPLTTYSYNMQTHEMTVLQRDPAGGFDPSHYTLERIMAKADDRVEVPIIVFYKKGLSLDGSSPMLLNAYGSYGIPTNPYFSRRRASFLERGVCCAFAQIRGGGDLGYTWYQDGKLLKKRNTFTDFIACAEHLIKEKYTSPDRFAIEGASAGGLLMGTVINMRPDLFKVCSAGVPFVDTVTTMFDTTLPLTTQEWEEWGDPTNKKFYDYMLSYSPYDNVERKDYPSLCVTSGLTDEQVSVHEPAKWVAKLVDLKTDNNPVFFHIEMEAGHHGASGRFAAYNNISKTDAFILSKLGISE